MKKRYSLLRWPCLLQDVLTDVYCSKQTGSSSTKVKPSPIISSFPLKLGRRKLSMQPKFVAAGENVVKTETQQTFVNGLLGFITLERFIPSEARVYCSVDWGNELPIDMGNLSALLINILLGSFQLFLHSDQPSEGEITCSAVSASRGEAALSTPEAVVASRTDRQTALMCNRRRPAATSSRRASFSALASANSS